MLTTPVLVSRFLPASVSPCLCGRSWALYTASHTVQFQNGKVCRKVTLFGYSRDFALLFTAQRVDKLRFKKMCLIGLTGLHSLISMCYQLKDGL